MESLDVRLILFLHLDIADIGNRRGVGQSRLRIDNPHDHVFEKERDSPGNQKLLVRYIVRKICSRCSLVI